MLKSWLATACGIGLLWGLAATAAAQEYDPEPQEPKTLGERMQDVGRAIFGGPTVPPPQSQTQSTPPSFPGYGTRMPQNPVRPDETPTANGNLPRDPIFDNTADTPDTRPVRRSGSPLRDAKVKPVAYAADNSGWRRKRSVGCR